MNKDDPISREVFRALLRTIEVTCHEVLHSCPQTDRNIELFRERLRERFDEACRGHLSNNPREQHGLRYLVGEFEKMLVQLGEISEWQEKGRPTH